MNSGDKNSAFRACFYLEDRQEVSDILSLLVILLSKANGAVHPVVLREKGAAAQPHPVAIVHKMIRVNEKAIKCVTSLLPGDIQVSSRQEASLQIVSSNIVKRLQELSISSKEVAVFAALLCYNFRKHEDVTLGV